MRIVLDTNVVVAAMRSKSGASAELVRLAARKQLTLVGGLALALEYIDVCERPESWRGSRASQQDATRFAAEVVALLDPADIYFRWRPAAPDPASSK